MLITLINLVFNSFLVGLQKGGIRGRGHEGGVPGPCRPGQGAREAGAGVPGAGGREEGWGRSG